MKNFVDCHWLKKHLNDSKLFVIDCRFDLFDPVYGRNAYDTHHIKRAHFFDINQDLSGPKSIHGGARPLPQKVPLLKRLEAIGLTLDASIVCYDDKTYSSGRAWWQFKYLGFENVYILNGGYQQWCKLQYPTTTECPSENRQGHLPLAVKEALYCDINFVKEAQEDPSKILVDSREAERYTGAYEPLYSKKGHIPGAINIDCSLHFTAEGLLLPMGELKAHFNKLDKTHKIIPYCGSGISAAINFAILDELGYDAQLYVGSASDWISYEENILEEGTGHTL